MFINAKPRTTTKTQHQKTSEESDRGLARARPPRRLQLQSVHKCCHFCLAFSVFPWRHGRCPFIVLGRRKASALSCRFCPSEPPTGSRPRSQGRPRPPGTPCPPASPAPAAWARFARPWTDTSLLGIDDLCQTFCLDRLGTCWVPGLGLGSGRRGENRPRRVAPTRGGRLRSGRLGQRTVPRGGGDETCTQM